MSKRYVLSQKLFFIHEEFVYSLGWHKVDYAILRSTIFFLNLTLIRGSRRWKTRYVLSEEHLNSSISFLYGQTDGECSRPSVLHHAISALRSVGKAL